MRRYKDTKEVYCDACFNSHVVDVTNGWAGALGHILGSRHIWWFQRLIFKMTCIKCGQSRK